MVGKNVILAKLRFTLADNKRTRDEGRVDTSFNPYLFLRIKAYQHYLQNRTGVGYNPKLNNKVFLKDSVCELVRLGIESIPEALMETIIKEYEKQQAKP